MKIFGSIISLLIIWSNSYAQGRIGIGTQQPTPSAILDVQSTTGGLKLPVMSKQQRLSIANPAQGLMIFDTDLGTLLIFDGKDWRPIYGSSVNEKQPNQYIKPIENEQQVSDIDMYDEWLIIGLPNAKAGNVNNGGAVDFYRLESGSWQHFSRIQAPNAQSNAKFGHSVAITNGYAIVGAPGRSISKNNTTLKDVGSSYIYKWTGTTWVLQNTLLPANAAQGDSIGFSVDITWNCSLLAAVGAPRDNSKSNNAGAVYLYAGSGGGWTEVTKITHNNLNANDYFGYSVSVDCGYILAGAPGYDYYRANQTGSPVYSSGIGTVFAFRYQQGVLTTQQQWYCFYNQSGAGFGTAVDNNNIAFLTGAPGLNMVFQLSLDVPSSLMIFIPPSSMENQQFGHSLKIEGTNVLIGAPQRTYNPDYSLQGAAFVYNLSSKQIIDIIKKTPDKQNELLGSRVTIYQGRYALAGNIPGLVTGIR